MKQKKPPRSNSFETELSLSNKFYWNSSYIPIRNKKSKFNAYSQTGYKKVILRYGIFEGKNLVTLNVDTKSIDNNYNFPINQIQAFLKSILKQDFLKTTIFILYYLIKMFLDITTFN